MDWTDSWDGPWSQREDRERQRIQTEGSGERETESGHLG